MEMGTAKALSVQGRVIWALMLREIHTLYGDARLGYLWVIIQNTFSLGVFWGLRTLMGASAPHGLSVLAFLMSGFMLWNIFSSLVLKSITAVDANFTLLTFPQVTPVDVLLARAGVLVATEVLVAFALLSIGYYVGYPLNRPDWFSVFAILFLTVCLGLGFGFILSALRLWVTALDKLMPMFFRILFFVSGIFFSLKNMPLPYGVVDVLNWNPMLQLIEWLRNSMAPSYPAAEVNVGYLCILTLVTLTIGLLLERRTRGLSKNTV
jgi:capsular polysaccharide transport system permease protein